MTERILVIDSDKTLANLLVNLLQINGYSASSCDYGRHVVAEAIEKGVDLVLLDIVMPGLDGLDEFVKLRGDKMTEEIPVVIISELSDELYLLEGWVRDGDGYISKPFDPENLIQTVRTVLERTAEDRLEERGRRIEELLETIQRLEEQYLEKAV